MASCWPHAVQRQSSQRPNKPRISPQSTNETVREAIVVTIRRRRRRRNLRCDILPPGPRPESNTVTEIPFPASMEAHTAPETGKNQTKRCPPSQITTPGTVRLAAKHRERQERQSKVGGYTLPPPTTATLATVALMAAPLPPPPPPSPLLRGPTRSSVGRRPAREMAIPPRHGAAPIPHQRLELS